MPPLIIHPLDFIYGVRVPHAHNSPSQYLVLSVFGVNLTLHTHAYTKHNDCLLKAENTCIYTITALQMERVDPDKDLPTPTSPPTDPQSSSPPPIHDLTNPQAMSAHPSTAACSSPTTPVPTSPTQQAVVPYDNLEVLQRQRDTTLGRRLAVDFGKASMSIADGILLSSSVLLNPTISAALVLYESSKAIRDYRTGAPNTLGYRTSKTDVALRIGKEVGGATLGLAIGHGVGALISLSAIPLAGQLVVATLLSVSLSICACRLLTQHVDRLFVRLQIRSQCDYPSSEDGARCRFEEILEDYHDLSSYEVCKIVQQYADYRVASGWESPTDIDEYSQIGDIRLMPVSYQHFALVQLQRKWGFLRDRRACKKVYQALMLQHHPDRCGSTELAASLNRDFEVYAYCQGWVENCPNLLAVDAAVTNEKGAPAVKRRNVVVAFLRSLFRRPTNSAADASDLHQFGLLALEAGTRTQLHQLDELCFESNRSLPGSPTEGLASTTGAATGATKQRSVAQVLSVLRQAYESTKEAIIFSSLAAATANKDEWDAIREEVFLFNRMQCFLHTTGHMEKESDHQSSLPHVCRGFHWSTRAEALARREESRGAIIKAVFTAAIHQMQESAMSIWSAAQSMAKSYFKQCALGKTTSNDDGAKQTLETLLSMHHQLENLSDSVKNPWKEKEREWVRGALAGQVTFVEQIREVSLTASAALAGEHAKVMQPVLREACDVYFATWDRKNDTARGLTAELNLLERDIERHAAVGDSDPEIDEAAKTQLSDYAAQLLMIEEQRVHMDRTITELADTCYVHLPETVALLDALPSTCMRCLDSTTAAPRWVLYERERSMASYQRVQDEPASFIDAARAETEEDREVRYKLCKALYVDSLSGTTTSCWLKVYSFANTTTSLDDTQEDTATSLDDIQEDTATEKWRASRHSELIHCIVSRELLVSNVCRSHRILSPTDFFCDTLRQEIVFHLPRDSTQQRLRSVSDVRRRIEFLGVRWLHDAIQCLIDLHSCGAPHGSIGLSSFTFDDFGNTVLGSFGSVLRDLTVTLSMEKDIMNFGDMILSQAVAHLDGALNRSPVSSPTQEYLPFLRTDVAREDTIRIFREVGSRLVGKEEPSWNLQQARTFVRRYLQYNFDSSETNYLFSKEIAVPPSWVHRHRLSIPQLIIPLPPGRLRLHAWPNAQLYHNMNLPLWEVYWRCRRTMTLDHQRDFCIPPVLRTSAVILPCADDCEVNERFLWYPCRSDEEAWQVCQLGFRRRLHEPMLHDACLFELALPPAEELDASGSWGLLCRAALGTVVDEAPTAPRTTSGDEDTDRLLAAARERSYLLPRPGDADGEGRACHIEVGSPWARCYPEYVVNLRL